jgi:hypothetical protein
VRSKNEISNLAIQLFSGYVRARAGVLRTGVIFVVGDSHTRSFRYSYPAVVKHFGGSTAHNLISATSATNSRHKLAGIVSRANWERDSILLVFGEIDCRLHIYRAFESGNDNNDLQSIVDSTVDRYFVAVNKIIHAGAKVMICGLPPAANGVDEKKTPVYGPLEDRIRITDLFNTALERQSAANGVGFLDIHSFSSDEAKNTLPQFRFDGVHLNRNLGKTAVRFIRQYWASK